jgi:hypothetical protein
LPVTYSASKRLAHANRVVSRIPPATAGREGERVRFVLSHRHPPSECGVAYAAWKGFESPLRHGSALSSCRGEGATHLLMWTVEAESAADALAMLPDWVASRTEASAVAEVAMP